MELHTFIADSAGEAVEQVRAQLGPAAVVLSVRKLPPSGLSRLWKGNSIEIIAGIPPEQTATPDPLQELRAELREIKQQLSQGAFSAATMPGLSDPPEFVEEHSTSGPRDFLLKAGVLPVFVQQILEECEKTQAIDALSLPEQISAFKQVLARRWKPASRAGGTHIFIGPAGSGKSTVLCKWLAQLALLEGEPCTVVQLDSDTANLSPQPSIFSEIVGAGFERSLPDERLLQGRTIFVDLPAANGKGASVLQALLQRFPGAQVHLVLNAAYESSILLEQARSFSAFPVTDLILTHLEETPSWAKLWNLVLGTNYCLRYFSSGQNIPGGLVKATPELLWSRPTR